MSYTEVELQNGEDMPRYSPAGVLVLSTMFEMQFPVERDDLIEALESRRHVPSHYLNAAINDGKKKGFLVKHGLVSLDGPTGISYNNEAIKYMEYYRDRVAHSRDDLLEISKFSAVRYKILEYLETASTESGWLEDPENTEDIMDLLTASLELEPSTARKAIKDYEIEGVISVIKTVDESGTTINVMNARLGAIGKQQLEKIRQEFPEQVVEVTAVKDGEIMPDFLSEEDARDRVFSMCEQINVMLEELGEPPLYDPYQECSHHLNYVRKSIPRLNETILGLEWRIDSRNQKLLAA